MVVASNTSTLIRAEEDLDGYQDLYTDQPDVSVPIYVIELGIFI